MWSGHSCPLPVELQKKVEKALLDELKNLDLA